MDAVASPGPAPLLPFSKSCGKSEVFYLLFTLLN
jgi:hypothetical protein